MNDPLEIRRMDGGGRSILDASEEQACEAFADLLSIAPHVAKTLAIAGRDLARKCASSGVTPCCSASSAVGFVYFGFVDMAQSQRKRAQI